MVAQLRIGVDPDLTDNHDVSPSALTAYRRYGLERFGRALFTFWV
jgi:hypothetical protein